MRRTWLAAALSGCAAASALLAIVTGAMVTDQQASLGPPHRILGIAALVLALPLWRERWVQFLMAPGVLLAVLPVAPVLHALGAPLLLGPAIALALPLQPMAGEISAGLRKIVVAGPPLVLLQIALGAAYRHKAIGVVWHLAGAMSVAGLLVVMCVLLLRQIPKEKAPRLGAGWLNGILVTQVTLGMAALLLRMLDMDAGHVAAAHVTGGSITFAGSLVLWRVTQRS